MNADDLASSPAEMYPRNDPIVLHSNDDPASYLTIDLASDPTDQMDVVGLSLRCKNDIADAIHHELKKIRRRSEAASRLLRGNLGLEAP
jgi:hypothetical protein